MTVVLIRTGAKDGGGDAENPAAGNKKIDKLFDEIFFYSSKRSYYGIMFSTKDL